MRSIIQTLFIAGYRALRHLEIQGLGRVNLITGGNNTGKSSVLEALRILAAEASPRVLASILRYREEDVEEPEESAHAAEDGASILSGLFSGFPSLHRSASPIAMSANGSDRSQRLVLSVERFLEQRLGRTSAAGPCAAGAVSPRGVDTGPGRGDR
jgi:hypothetical protein